MTSGSPDAEAAMKRVCASVGVYVEALEALEACKKAGWAMFHDHAAHEAKMRGQMQQSILRELEQARAEGQAAGRREALEIAKIAVTYALNDATPVPQARRILQAIDAASSSTSEGTENAPQ